MKNFHIKLGESINLNGYPMELISVGNLLVAENQRVEIAIFQKLEDAPPSPPTPQENLIKVLLECGFTKGVQVDIIKVAIGRDTFRSVADLTDAECDTAEAAIISAVLDREQLEEGRD